jgi:hypothetical protein
MNGILLGYSQGNEAFIKIQGFVLIIVALLVTACFIHKGCVCIIDRIQHLLLLSSFLCQNVVRLLTKFPRASGNDYLYRKMS